jgi:hypothetical protein
MLYIVCVALEVTRLIEQSVITQQDAFYKDYYPSIWLKGLWKPTKTSGRTADLRAEILARDLANTKEERVLFKSCK